MIEYNRIRHLELLKHSQTLQQNGKHIYDESKKSHFELLSYSATLYNQLKWENRKYYFKAIQKFLDSPINFSDVKKKNKAVDDQFNLLKKSLIIPEHKKKSEGFADYIDEITVLFDRCCPEELITETYELSEERIKEIIHDILIEMKNKYPLDEN